MSDNEVLSIIIAWFGLAYAVLYLSGAFRTKDQNWKNLFLLIVLAPAILIAVSLLVKWPWLLFIALIAGILKKERRK